MPGDPNPDAPEDPQEEPVEPVADNEPFDEDRAKAKIAKANSEAANLRRRLKELEPLAAKAKELEDASKTETQKAQEALTTAQQRAADAESRLMRLEVAVAKGLTPAQAKRLVGSTKEELEADADELLASFKSDDSGDRPLRRPVERLRGGGDPTEEPAETDPEKLAALVRRG
jgi:chromosome segregation ATPase